MTVYSQKDRALQFRQMHTNPPLLVLPNAWDAASARIFEQAGFRAIATTSSGVAASLGYPDGEKISLHMLVETVEHITRVIRCPLTVDIEAGYGGTIAEVLQTVQAVLAAGAVGINIEDSNKRRAETLLDTSYQVELIKAIRELGRSMDIPLVINARTDVFLLAIGDPSNRFKEAVLRMNLYRQAGADCLFPIGISDAHTITELIHAVNSPLNILAGSATPSLTELAQLRVARVSFGSGPMRAVLAHLQHIAHEWIEYGTYTNMTERTISGAQLRSLFE
ncbi:MAG TPA: isocitrate lyase/phosphoenolpyruvate mutase family protein [Ktedonobacteraceae bacterium]|nr:isocitrate lyase/phosphoenolpyruvate mutase family protein [Ktedonobacteraceae bacterium]